MAAAWPRGMACVVIGRNEGPRLIESLESVRAISPQLVYVDSGSTDRSAEAAEQLGVRSLRLDPGQPFSAARGRNEGLDLALQQWPDTRYVLFLDGDCTLVASFPSAAASVLDQDERCAIVTGHLSEQYPDRSLYNRLCAIEWRSPAGPMEGLDALGGIMTVRVAAFREVGGFNPQAIAGEEADLAVRLRLAGYTMIKADAPMAIHDARILTFRQWWIRAVRGGYAYAHRYDQHRRIGLREGGREVWSSLFWGMALPLLVAASLYATRGLSLLLLGGYAVLALRMYRHYRWKGLSSSDASLAARFGLLAKFAHVAGIIRFMFKGAEGGRIIEYK